MPAGLAAQGRLFLLAVQALTRVPVSVVFDGEGLRRAVRFFPLVGALVGAAGALVLAAAGAGLPPLAAAAISVGATLLLTGALHEDGLADCCDGFGGGRDAESVLRIMKDSRIGAFGALGLLVAVGAKLGLLGAMAGQGWAMAAALVAAQASSRAWCVGVAAALPYARAGGLAGGIAAPRRRDVAMAAALGLAALAPLGVRGAAALVVSALLALAVALHARRRIGGYTGDVLGAVQQVTELAVLGAVAWRAA